MTTTDPSVQSPQALGNGIVVGNDIGNDIGNDGVDDAFTDRARARLDTTGTAGTDAEISPQATGSVDADYPTRSEKHLQVGTERVETGRARLRKVAVTEQQTVTVPVGDVTADDAAANRR